MWRNEYGDRDKAAKFLEERVPTYRDALDIVHYHDYDSYLVELVIQKYNCSLRMACKMIHKARYHYKVVVAAVSKPKLCSLGKCFQLAHHVDREDEVWEAIINRNDWKTTPIEICIRFFKDFVWGSPDHPMARSIFERNDCPPEEREKYSDEYFEDDDIDLLLEINENLRVPWEDFVRAYEGEDD